MSEYRNDTINEKKNLSSIIWKPLLAATLRSFVLFIVLDVALENALKLFFSVDVKAALPRTDFGTSFLVQYYGLIWLCLLMILIIFAVCRPLFPSTTRTIFFIGLTVYLLAGMLLLQMVNLGFLPISMFIQIGASNALTLPLILWTGAATYAQHAEREQK